MPTDPRLKDLSPFQELWILSQARKRKNSEDERTYDLVKLICSFIDADRAKKLFTEGERVEVDDSDFLAQMKEIDPNFDTKEYVEILKDME